MLGSDQYYEELPIFSTLMLNLLKWMDNNLNDCHNHHRKGMVGSERMKTLAPRRGVDPPSW
jgi:hypothetical protein